MRSFRFVAFVCFACACGHGTATETTPVVTPVSSASGTATPAPTASASAAPASTESNGTFCESQSPPMPNVDTNDTRTGCWYAGTSCIGHGGQEGQQFEVSGTTVSGEFVHGGCNPGSYALVYEPSTSPLKVRVCAKRSPPQKCSAMIRDGASWDVAALLRANHATDVTIVKP